MKTFTASIAASFSLIESDDLTGATAERGKFIHDTLQIEANTAEAAQRRAMTEALRVWPEGHGYMSHSANVAQLEITSTICFEVADFAAKMSEQEMEKGMAALAEHPALPYLPPDCLAGSGMAAIAANFTQLAVGHCLGSDVIKAIAAARPINIAELIYPKGDK
jgi:hypothetical protein